MCACSSDPSPCVESFANETSGCDMHPKGQPAAVPVCNDLNSIDCVANPPAASGPMTPGGQADLSPKTPPVLSYGID